MNDLPSESANTARRGKTLAGVGVGPGDPELVTVKAVRVLESADLVLVPVLDLEERGRAEATVRANVTHDRVRRVVFALNERTDRGRREAAWDAAAHETAAAFAAGARTVAFATIGDPNVYSTFTYLAETVRDLVEDVTVTTVPGITAMQDLAARSGTVLCEGTESLALLPLTAGLEAFRAALASHDTVVGYKSGRHLQDALTAVREAGRPGEAVHGACLGLPDEDIRPAAQVTGPAHYLSTLIVPGKRTSRGGKL
jgi:precorrin-2/cobalt-factor-2 C20-methyltransferase